MGPATATKIAKISRTATYESGNAADYVRDVDTDLTTLVIAVNQGFKPLEVTTTQRNALTTIFRGMIIWNITTDRLEVYNGVAWVAV